MKKLLGIVVLYFVCSSASVGVDLPFKNIVIHEKQKKYEEIIFEDFDGKLVNLSDQNSKIYLLNFWATWCEPCKKEMPSLDQLQKVEGIDVFPINLESKNQVTTKKFYEDLKIKNLSIYFDPDHNLVKLLSLRGVPSTIILNKNRQEVARVLGALDFSDEKFLKWINSLLNKQ